MRLLGRLRRHHAACHQRVLPARIGFGLHELRLGLGERYLMVVQRIPPAMLSNALAVQAANSEYQQRSLERGGLRRMYLGTLTLVLILATFAALLLAVTLGNQLARPLLMLADGVRRGLRALDQFARGVVVAGPAETVHQVGGRQDRRQTSRHGQRHQPHPETNLPLPSHA